MKGKEFILCAAIWINDRQEYDGQPDNIEQGYVICGRRHHNCYETLDVFTEGYNEYLKGLNLSDEDYKKQQGFVTSLDRYVDRKEAWVIAKENNQIVIGLEASDQGDDSILISENLY